MINVHSVTQAGRHLTISPMWQWDKGQVVDFSDTDIPDSAEVQFHDGSVKVVVDSCVAVPDKLLQSYGDFHAWVQVIGDDNETTRYAFDYKVLCRTQKNDYVEPEDQQTFREDIQTLVNKASDIAAEAAETASEAEELAGDLNAKIAHVDAQTEIVDADTTKAIASAESAAESAESAKQSAAVAGYMIFDIDDSGHLVETRTDNIQVEFALNSEGHLEVVA